MSHHHHSFEKKTLWVVLLTFGTMVVEILIGLSSKSMALLADGIHMGSHVFAIGLSWAAYVWLRKLEKRKDFKGKETNILALAGYTSGIFLLIFSGLIMKAAIERYFDPQEIIIREALIVAVIGLIVNIASAFLLHHDHEHADHNIRAAYLHVVADALTSISAIIGLVAAYLWGITVVDTIAAGLSSLLIMKWSIGLMISSGRSIIGIEKKGNH